MPPGGLLAEGARVYVCMWTGGEEACPHTHPRVDTRPACGPWAGGRSTGPRPVAQRGGGAGRATAPLLAAGGRQRTTQHGAPPESSGQYEDARTQLCCWRCISGRKQREAQCAPPRKGSAGTCSPHCRCHVRCGWARLRSAVQTRLLVCRVPHSAKLSRRAGLNPPRVGWLLLLLHRSSRGDRFRGRGGGCPSVGKDRAGGLACEHSPARAATVGFAPRSTRAKQLGRPAPAGLCCWVCEGMVWVVLSLWGGYIHHCGTSVRSKGRRPAVPRRACPGRAPKGGRRVNPTPHWPGRAPKGRRLGAAARRALPRRVPWEASRRWAASQESPSRRQRRPQPRAGGPSGPSLTSSPPPAWCGPRRRARRAPRRPSG